MSLWSGLKKLGKFCVRVVVRGIELFIEVCHAVADTCLVVAGSGYLGFGGGKLPDLARAAVSNTLSPSTLNTVGAAIQAKAAATQHIVTGSGIPKAAMLTKIAAAKAGAVATAAFTFAYGVLIVGAVWLLLKGIKRLSKFLEDDGDFAETVEFVQGSLAIA